MKPASLALLAMALMTLFACNHANESSNLSIAAIDKRSDNEIIDFKEEERTPQLSADSIVQNPGKKGPTAPIPPKTDWDKKIIKTASVNLEVENYKTYYSFLKDKVSAAGGYVAQENQSQNEYKIENVIAIKVPVDQFDNALTSLIDGAKKVNEKMVSSSDVTAQLIDTKSRLEAKKQVRLRYLELLQQAHKMEDILSVQQEINGIQEEIESANGQIASLGHSAAYSTINITYFQVLNVAAQDSGKPSFGSEVKDAFYTGWKWLGGLVVALLNIWPLLTILSFGVLFIKKRISAKPGSKATA